MCARPVYSRSIDGRYSHQTVLSPPRRLHGVQAQDPLFQGVAVRRQSDCRSSIHIESAAPPYPAPPLPHRRSERSTHQASLFLDEAYTSLTVAPRAALLREPPSERCLSIRFDPRPRELYCVSRQFPPHRKSVHLEQYVF